MNIADYTDKRNERMRICDFISDISKIVSKYESVISPEDIQTLNNIKIEFGAMFGKLSLEIDKMKRLE